MSEDRKKTYRLFKVSAELNVAIDTLADALRDKGFEAVDASDPNAKITSDMYEFLVNKYAQDKQSKEKAALQKLAQKEQTVARVRKPLQPLDDGEGFDSSPLTAIELRQKLNQQATEPAALRPLVIEPEAEPAPPRRLDALPPDADKPASGLSLDLPPLPDFIARTPPPERTAPPPEPPAPAEPTAREAEPVQAVPEPAPEPVQEPPAEPAPKPPVDAVADALVQPQPASPQPPVDEAAAPPLEVPSAIEAAAAAPPEAPERIEVQASREPAQVEAPVLDTPPTSPPPTAASTPVETATPAAPEEPLPSEPPLFKSETPSIGLKVVGKVDLDQMDPRRGKRKPESKPDKPEAKSDTKADTKTERKGEAKTDPKVERRGEAKTDPKVERRSEAKTDPKPAAKGDRKPAAPAEPRKTEPRTGPPAPREAAPTAAPVPRPEPPAPSPSVPANDPLPAELAPAAELADKAEAEEPNVIRASDHAPKLSGLKIMGKIDLTADMVSRRSMRTDKDKPKPADASKAGAPPAAGSAAAAAAAAADADKRKRKRKRKGAAPEATTSPTTRTTLRPPSGKPATGTGGKPAAGKTSDATKKEAASNLRNTLGAIGRTAPRKRQSIRKEKRTQRANIRQQQFEQELADANILEVTEYLTANELANLMDVSVNEVIGKCMELGLIVSINQRINAEVISLIAEEFGYEVKFVSVDEAFAAEDEEQDDPESLEPRHPIVTVMGHVDHGKTSLLDYIRKTNVMKGEAGGITQHIGAYEVKLPDGRRIAFLDTPGHEAFTAMRARGAQVTDIAIIVIAADDQIMPQTREAINHAQAAGVKMVFAINKIDKEGAKPEVIRQQLAEMNLLVEDWGGPYQCQEISAKQGIGIEELLEKVLLEAELLELKANPNRPARGTVIEAQLDRGRGVVATLLVQAGTLSVGDIIVANCNYGRIKAMFDDKQKKIKKAGPSTPVLILGLDGVPQAGDKFQVMESDREARELATRRQQLLREQTIRMHKNITLEEIARRSALGDFQELNVIVKGDVDGSVEALADSLIKLSAEEVAVKIIMKGVGEISESDVLLASASNAIIVGFQVRPSANARKLLQQESVDVRLYSVIYDAINEIKDALEGLLKPTIEEEVVGVAQVRDTFRVVKVGTIAGCMITEGKINRNNPVRVIRDGIVQYTGKIESLRRFKDDVREVTEGFECGISVENFNDIKVGDLIEAYVTKEVKRTID